MKLKYGPYSPSRLETATCGYAFKRQYIDLEGREAAKVENLPQARGSAAHLVLEQITKKMCAEETPVFSEAEIRQWLVEAVAKHPAAYQAVNELLDIAKEYVRKPPPRLTRDAQTELRFAVKPVQVSGWVEIHSRHRFPGDAPKLGPVEHNGAWIEPVLKEDSWLDFEECDYDDPEAIARGRADIMFIADDTTSADVIDHKTQPNVEDADTFQMGFYAWVISKTHPFLNEIRTTLHFSRYGYYSDPYVWSKEQLAQIEDDIMTRIAIIESRTDWGPTPHKGCQYCPFIAECPAMKEAIEVDEGGTFIVKMQNLKILGNTQKAVKLAGVINVMEEIVKRSKEELKDFVRAAGAGIAIPGKVFEFRASEPKVNWDKVNKTQKIRDQAYEIFEKYGLDPKGYMGFSQTVSKDVWLVSDENLLKELSEIFPKKIETEFRGYKI